MTLYDLMGYRQPPLFDEGRMVSAMPAMDPRAVQATMAPGRIGQGWQPYLDRAKEQLVAVVGPGQSFHRKQEDFGTGWQPAPVEERSAPATPRQMQQFGPQQGMDRNKLLALVQYMQRNNQQQPYMMQGI